MSRPALLLLVTSIAVSAALAASPSNAGTADAQAAPVEQPKVCKMVASDQRNSKPYELCLSKAEWDTKAIADAKDANRIVCHYEDEPGTRLHSRKICMPASAWNARREGDRQEVENIQMKTCVPGAGC